LTERISKFLKNEDDVVSEKDGTVLEDDLVVDTEDKYEIREETRRKVDTLLDDDN
jgi:hypothetical protein